jgi:hypothetical protein
VKEALELGFEIETGFSLLEKEEGYFHFLHCYLWKCEYLRRFEPVRYPGSFSEEVFLELSG